MTDYLKRLKRFVAIDMWRIRRSDLAPRKSFWLKQLRVIVLSVREFNRDKCSMRAASLTYYTVLSIVPVIAMAFGIAKGFLELERLEGVLREWLPVQAEVEDHIIRYAHNLLSEAKGGVVTGIGVFIIFWTVVKVLTQIERSFNDIWGIRQSRSLTTKLSAYLTFAVVCPLFLVAASSLTVVATGAIASVTERIDLFGLGAVVRFITTLIPYTLVWILFTFAYIFMPNTKVNFTSGLLGGIVAGVIYQTIQFTYISVQSQATENYGAIYGSFAAVPLFLIWVQLSWLTLLYGAELAFAHNSVETYEFEPDCLNLSPALKRLLLLATAQECVRAFHEEEPPPTSQYIYKCLQMPRRLTNDILYELVEAGILIEVRQSGADRYGYHPARNINEITLAWIIEKLDNAGVNMNTIT
ncbi:YihY family inner membrane protein, partial [bacterium]|nr:YihY family inner membrane protein [bacterium]